MVKMFHTGKMASDQLDADISNAVLATDAPEGALLTLGDLAADTTYAADGKQYDVYNATAPAAITDDIVLLDLAKVSDGAIAGNDYRLGIKLFDRTLNAGEIGRVRRPALHDKFWIGEGNFAATPTVGHYGIPTAAAFTLTDSATQGDGFAVKILLSREFDAGMTANGNMYLCEVVGL
jgi:hypothetical protein